MKNLFLIPFLIFAIGAKSQETTTSTLDKTQHNFTFSLDEAIAYALTNNYSAVNADRDISSAKSKKMGNYCHGFATNKCKFRLSE